MLSLRDWLPVWTDGLCVPGSVWSGVIWAMKHWWINRLISVISTVSREVTKIPGFITVYTHCQLIDPARSCGITTCLMRCTFLIPWCDFCVKKKFHLWFLLLNVSFMSKGQEHGTFSWRCLLISFWTGLADQRLYKDKMPGPPLRRAYSQVWRVGFSFLQEKWKWLQIENEAVLITSLCILSVDVFCFIDSCTLSLMEWSAFMYIADD